MASRDAVESPRSAPRRSGAPVVPKDGGAASLLSPRFRSAAELAGWDEESVFAALIVEDTPVRESRRKRRSSTSVGSGGGGGSTGSNTRKRRSRRQAPMIPPVTLSLDDDDKLDTATDVKKDAKGKEDEKPVVVGDKEASGSGEKRDAMGKLPCMDRLREELSCAICLEICFEPSTTPCGHSFCMKCLKHAAAKCGKRCPKCRQLIRSCTVNTVLWNTIQLLFPNEVEARRTSIASCNDDVSQSPSSSSFSQGGMRTRNNRGALITEGRTRSSYRNFVTAGSTTNSSNNGGFIRAHGSTRDSNSRRGFVPASQLITNRSSARSEQSDDAALAYRLQQQEFMNAFQSDETQQRPPSPPRNTVSTARDNLRAMASRAIRLRSRGWPI
ncbi:hypothetical protein PR202_gb16035 [Eleusine coracana subsp. coracana]|uniref:RING-type E3 ubiquitin transferase n=1 Tax=Eleusine coracana subsp. coracana TaxID=191504 RepID=A0AAV5EZ62_ELECO|nr:hypothetical protein PR202_gb16035 [Eleusine coracana subsp. coracana]